MIYQYCNICYCVNFQIADMYNNQDQIKNQQGNTKQIADEDFYWFDFHQAVNIYFNFNMYCNL